MQTVKEILGNLLETRIIGSLIVILISIILYNGVNFFFKKSEERSGRIVSDGKRKTYLKLIRNVIRYVFVVVTILIILQINGINVTSMLAGLGIAGVVFGLAIQDWLKDIIRGSSLLSDQYFAVGDIVEYDGIEGEVTMIGLKTTKIKDLSADNIISIANRNIERVLVFSGYIYIRIPFPYETKLCDMEKIADEITKEAEKDENIKTSTPKGVQEFKASNIDYLLEVFCDPKNKLRARRAVLRAILVVFERHEIAVPFDQIDVHLDAVSSES